MPSPFLYFDLISLCGILQNITALHAIRGFRMQRDPKGNWLPLAKAAGEYQIAACNTFLFLWIFFNCACGIHHLLAFCPKTGRLSLELKQKGLSNISKQCNNVTQVILFIVILNSSLLDTLSMKSAKGIMFHKLKKLLV